MEHVKIVLLRRVAGLGNIGDVANVKPGFARNYLLPKKIALRATTNNLKLFDAQRSKIEAENAHTRSEATKIAEKMIGFSVSLVRQASEKGHLYGSVSARDIATAVKNNGISLTASQVNLHAPIKELGVYDVVIDLHPEVSVTIKMSIAKSEEEAKLQLTPEASDTETKSGKHKSSRRAKSHDGSDDSEAELSEADAQENSADDERAKSEGTSSEENAQ